MAFWHIDFLQINQDSDRNQCLNNNQLCFQIHKFIVSQPSDHIQLLKDYYFS
jgi:hypothetical protein